MYRVIIFGYNFPHIKSENFIHILKKNKVKISAFVGANSIEINLPKKIYQKKISQKPIFNPKELCKLYSIPFYEVVHNSSNTLKIIKKTKANLGIVAGARILKSNIINSLKYGIINFHPGKIPEASGLDSLFWSIYKNIDLYVTTHFINTKIDSGCRIFQKKINVNKEDRIEDIKLRLSLAEYDELFKLCKNYLLKNMKIPSKKIVDYKFSNKAMNENYQKKVLKNFESWKKKFYEN